MFPFFLGFCIAFVLNVPMRALEKKFWPQTDKKALNALRRPTCILVSLVLILAILTAVVMLVVPELVNAFGVLADQVPVFLKNAQAWLLANGDAFPALQDWLSSAQIDWNSIGKTLFGYVTTGAGNILGGTVPVSYTHLDVYKRQTARRIISSSTASAISAAATTCATP